MTDFRISHYRVTRAIGKGGMGEVYEAEDETLQRRVALKSIHSEARLDPELRSRFLREARVLSQLDHPNICRIFDYISSGDGDYIVLELIEGADLGRVIAGGISRERAMVIALEVTGALAAAHAAGVVHRDIKPGNVMIASDGSAKVLDFGLSRVHSGAPPASATEKPRVQYAGTPRIDGTMIFEIAALSEEDSLLSGDSSVHTLRGTVLGTLRYMSPEQARGELVTAASDVYSLGLVLQELFTGVPGHDARTAGAQVLERARNAASAPVHGLPRDLTALITSLKSPSPARRPTAHEVLRRLRWIQDGPRRRLRRAAAVLAVLAVAVGATKYTLDLRRERSRAEARTEAALGMMGTLFEKQVPVLAEVGRLDASDAALEGVQAYFASMPRDELTDGELLKLAKLLLLVGGVHAERGQVADAEKSYTEALTLTSELEPRRARDSETILALGAAHFYLGELALRAQARPERALECFRAYDAAAQRNESVDPDPVNAVRERTYARNAIAGALLALGRTGDALAEQEAIVQMLRARASDGVERRDLLADLADNLSWLGSARFEAGEADAALAAFEEELSLRRGEVAADPRNAVARGRLSYCLTFIARVQLARQRADAALGAALAVAPALEARDLLVELRAADPENASNCESLYVALRTSGDALRAAGRIAEAGRDYTSGVELGEALLAADPTRTSVRATLLTLLLDAADASSAEPRPADATERLAARAVELLDAAPELPADERERIRARIQRVRDGLAAGRGPPAGAPQ